MAQTAELLNALAAPDRNIAKQAEEKLLEWERTSYEDFLGSLVTVLSSAENSDYLRIQSALQIKRSLTGQDDLAQRQKQERWFALNPEARRITKASVITVLGTANVQVSKQAAQAIEALARCELAVDDSWPDICEQLVKAFDEVFKRNPAEVNGPLVALGYYASVAAQSDFNIKEEEVNQVLGRISQAMNLQMPGDVQAAATAALADTVEFASSNMNRETERKQIMHLITSMTESPSDDAKEKAFQCLTTVLTMYYHHLRDHMGEIWKVTTSAIRDQNSDESVARQALNFWDEMAYEESLRLRQMQRAEAGEIPPLEPQDKSFGFIETVSQQLCQLVLEYCLLKQPVEPDESADDSEDSLHNAAEHCFSSMSECLTNKLLEIGFRYFHQNIGQPDWRNRQAALFVLGTVMRDNDMVQIQKEVVVVFPMVLQRMLREEPVTAVRETAAWAMGRICPYYKILGGEAQNMILGLVTGLQDKPRVAHMAAAALHEFAGAFMDQKDEQSNMLSGKVFESIASALWDAARREDSSEFKLMEDAYEALIKLIEVAAVDMHQLVGSVLLVHSLARLHEIREMKVRDETGYQEVELCDVVHACQVKLDQGITQFSMPNDNLALPQRIMETMIGILQKPSSNAHSDALLVIGELVRVFGDNFKSMLPTTINVVLEGLRAKGNTQVCVASVRLCSDLFIGINDPLLVQMVPALMPIIYENLRSSEIQRDVKPPHLTLLGDVATNIGPEQFKPFFADAMKIALEASQLDVDVIDEDLAEYLNQLRESAIQAIDFMILDVENSMLFPYLEPIFKVAMQISQELNNPASYYHGKDPNLCPTPSELATIRYRVSPSVTKVTLGLVGDVGAQAKETFCNEIKKAQSQFMPLFAAGRSSVDGDTAETARYAADIVQKWSK